MKKYAIPVLLAFLIAGCAKTEITGRKEIVTGQLPRPAAIWVFDIAAVPEDVPPESALSGVWSDTNHSPEEVALGRKLGARISGELINEISALGLNTQHGYPGLTPKINDIVIRGYIVSLVQGSAEKRVAIGLGAGASDLKVAVEGFQMTDRGLRKLGSGSTDASGDKTPGAAVGAAVLVATKNPVGLIVSTGFHLYDEKTGKSTVEGRADQTAKEIAGILKKRFQDEGWIQ